MVIFFEPVAVIEDILANAHNAGGYKKSHIYAKYRQIQRKWTQKKENSHMTFLLRQRHTCLRK